MPHHRGHRAAVHGPLTFAEMYFGAVHQGTMPPMTTIPEPTIPPLYLRHRRTGTAERPVRKEYDPDKPRRIRPHHRDSQPDILGLHSRSACSRRESAQGKSGRNRRHGLFWNGIARFHLSLWIALAGGFTAAAGGASPISANTPTVKRHRLLHRL